MLNFIGFRNKTSTRRQTPVSLELMKCMEKRSDEEALDLDVSREEQQWDEKTEKLIKRWMDEIYSFQMKYEIAGYRHRWLKRMYNLPTIIIPACLAPITATYDAWRYMVYVNCAGFTTTSILGAVNTFFDFARSEELSFDYCDRYGALYTDIELELTKPRRFRVPVDVYITKVMMRYDNLNANAPTLPKYINDMNIQKKTEIEEV